MLHPATPQQTIHPLSTVNIFSKTAANIAAAASIALAAGAAGVIATAPAAKADYASCNQIGDYTSCYGSNGSSYSSTTIGGTTFFNGSNGYGRGSYSGNCTTIGNYTSCNSY